MTYKLVSWEQEIGSGCDDEKIQHNKQEKLFPGIESLKAAIRREICSRMSEFALNYDYMDNGGYMLADTGNNPDYPSSLCIFSGDNMYPEEHHIYYDVQDTAGNHLDVDLSDIIAWTNHDVTKMYTDPIAWTNRDVTKLYADA